MRIRHEALEKLAGSVFEAMGSPSEEARLVAGSLVRANLMGHDSHGVGLVATYVRHFEAGLLKPGVSSRMVRDDGAILMFDGGRGFGRRVGGEAMAKAVERCADHGVVLMTLRNAHHLGRIGAYGEIAMAAGMISVHFVNVVDHTPCVAPWGGAESRFVTNPICISIPGTENTPPTVLDMATSRIALGKARVAMTRGEKLAEGLLIDPNGQPSNDPGVMYADPRGALLPFGEYKGTGLALVCELLAGGLSGGGTIQPGNPRHGAIVNNMLVLLFDPARLVDANWLQGEIDAMIGYVTSARAANPEEPVIVAGDRERKNILERTAAGISLDDNEWEELLMAGESLGLTRVQMTELVH